MWSSNSGHEHAKGGHMKTYCSLLHYILVAYKNIHFFGQEAQKRQCFFVKFHHFSHFIWSSNCAHEHEGIASFQHVSDNCVMSCKTQIFSILNKIQ